MYRLALRRFQVTCICFHTGPYKAVLRPSVIASPQISLQNALLTEDVNNKIARFAKIQ